MAYTNEALGKALEALTAAYQHFIENAKDAAIAAMGDTVIAQIKQDAKEHIASELAAQRAALEKAIETAKIALHNSAIEADTTLKQASETKKNELAALITAAENALDEKGAAAVQEIKTISEKEQAHLEKIKETVITEYAKKSKAYTDNLLITIFQNGYVQWPGMPMPDTLFTFEGYRWAEVNYDGCFFRAKGKGAHPFDGAEQGDAMRNFSFNYSYMHVPAWCNAGDDVFPGMPQYTTFSLSNFVPTAEENRPRNRTFIIWKLEKIEE